MSINYVQDVNQTVTSEDLTVETTKLSAIILKDNNAQPDTNIDFSQPSSDTNGKGLYYTNKNTEDGKTTYYFRGAVENNYVKLRNAGTSACTYKGKTLYYYNAEEGEYYAGNLTETQCLSTNVCIHNDKNGIFLFGEVGNNTEEECNNNNDGIWTNDKGTYNPDELWRIVRINEDSSIRLITENLIDHGKFNANYNDAAYIGYMYGTAGSSTYASTHANLNSSTIKTMLDTWYQNNLTNYSSIIADSGFCGDRSVAPSAKTWHSNDTALGYGKNATIYGAVARLSSSFGGNEVKPQFECPQNNDLYTIAASIKGNKTLTYPIGLISADEAVYAGGLLYTGYGSYSVAANTDYYLHIGADFWMSSPFQSYTTASILEVNRNGKISTAMVMADKIGVRPVINLKSTVEITGGNGTSSNPYVIKTN